MQKQIVLSYRQPKEELVAAIKNQIPFRIGVGNYSIFDEEKNYLVFSYETLILKQKNNKVIYFDEKKYSASTSKIQNLIREALMA